MILRVYLVILFLLFWVFESSAQQVIMSYDDFILIVRNHHPLSVQAALQSDRGEASLMKARGAFDPKLEGELKQKYFDGKQYYSLLHGGLKIPSWFGLSAQAGYESNDGNYLNPRDQVPDDGLWYAGLSLSLVQGLWIDERRAELKQAKVYRESSLLEQKLMMNELLFDASIAYWSWAEALEKYDVCSDMVSVAFQRLDNIRLSAKLGDKASIDTLEASIQLQSRQLLLKQAELKLQNSFDKLGIYLWEDGFIPLELKDGTKPQSLKESELKRPQLSDYQYRDSMLLDHPYILLLKNKIENKRIEVKWKQQQLLPRVDLKYNALIEANGSDFMAGYNAQNYTWGIQFSYPILTRKDRGSLKLTQIEMEQLSLDQKSKAAETSYKIAVALNVLANSAEQSLLFEKISNDYELLFLGEQSLFSIGESSLFLLNSREQSWMDARLKQISARYENQVANHLLDYELIRF